MDLIFGQSRKPLPFSDKGYPGRGFLQEFGVEGSRFKGLGCSTSWPFSRNCLDEIPFLINHN